MIHDSRSNSLVRGVKWVIIHAVVDEIFSIKYNVARGFSKSHNYTSAQCANEHAQWRLGSQVKALMYNSCQQVAGNLHRLWKISDIKENILKIIRVFLVMWPVATNQKQICYGERVNKHYFIRLFSARLLEIFTVWINTSDHSKIPLLLSIYR